MLHAPIVTFALTDHGARLVIRSICAACGQLQPVALATIPLEHLGALAVALLGACDVLKITPPQGHVVELNDDDGASEVPAGGRQPADEGDRMDE